MSEVTDEIVGRSLNFGYLLAHEPLLAYDGATAESYVYTDPDAALSRARRFVEVLVKKAAALIGHSFRAKDLHGRINELDAAGALSPNMIKACHEIRTTGNSAVHDHLGDIRKAILAVQDCFHLGLWLHNSINGHGEVRVFVPPQPSTQGLAETINKASGAARELNVLLATYRQRMVQHEQNIASPTQAESVERATAELIELVSNHSHVVRSMSERIDTFCTELESGLESRLQADRDLPGAQHTQHLENAKEAAGSTEAEFAQLLSIARQIVVENAHGPGMRSASAVNVAGAASSNIVIGGFYGGNFNQAPPKASDQP
ncbi:hypothetical protein Rhe02_74700 [Rhizocola hellebori]|uniref:DUF4145 domain-containing protein n=1 Tax=Rhizocola hellebori TaxID=1392758 RepID=A0A8J3VKT9_9ACTN|nr:DUF4145 domain-containing protein [Rhizocola hellebori]GIH09403.1 hypothetical protein Rhe02_74700 [Rhizocola hellebori]